MTALERPFDDPAVEAKFNALKKLQALKVKSLMTSLNAIKKENEKLKALGKDSRRTQMIQNLRVKLKNQEVMNDVLKELLVIVPDKDSEKNDMDLKPTDPRRKFYSREEVNDFLTNKNAGAPKRFRPKTREELENELTKFQKENDRLKKSLSQQQSDSDAKGSRARIGDYGAESKSQPKAESKATVSKNAETKETEELVESLKVLKLKDEMSELQADCRAKEEEIAHYKQENAKLRTSLGSCNVDEETLRCTQKQFEEMRDMYQKTSDELDDTSTALALAREECDQIRAQADAEKEALKVTIERLNNSLEGAMKQNKSMLDEIHKTERLNASTPSLTNPIPVKTSAPSAPASVSEPVDAAVSSPSQEDRKTVTPKETKVYEQKISNLRQKLADSESKLRELQEEPKKVSYLMEELRSKNDIIRELKRDINEMSRPSRGNDIKRGSTNGNEISEELVGNLYDEVKRLKSENDRLRQQRSSAPSPKRALIDNIGSESMQVRLEQLEQENKDLIAELSDLNSRLDKTGGFSDAAKLANALVEGFKNVLIDIHDKVILDSQSHALHAMSECKIEGEIMVKVDDPSIDRDKLIELLEVFEFFFEEHGSGVSGHGNDVDRNHEVEIDAESKSNRDDDAVPGSPFNT